jgi:hypothetical protein
MNTLRQDLSAALQSEAPAQHFRSSVKKLIDNGGDRDAVCADLESLRVGASDAEENVILDVLDFLSGWCSPQMKI